MNSFTSASCALILVLVSMAQAADIVVDVDMAELEEMGQNGAASDRFD